MKMRKKGKHKAKKLRAIRLNLDGTFDERKFKRDGAKLFDGSNEVLFNPASIFTENKRLGILRPKRRMLLFVEGTRQALKFKYTKEKGKTAKPSMDDPNPYWTMGEAAEFVDKKVTESLMRHKPMTWAQFVIILIPVILLLFITFFGFSSMGAF